MNENEINSLFIVLIDYGEISHSCSKVCKFFRYRGTFFWGDLNPCISNGTVSIQIYLYPDLKYESY